MTPEKPVPHLSEGEKVAMAAISELENNKGVVYDYADDAFIDGFKAGAEWQERQSTQMYTAEQCLAMLSTLRQRCAEEAKFSIQYDDLSEKLFDNVFFDDCHVCTDKQSILSIDLNEFIPPLTK